MVTCLRSAGASRYSQVRHQTRICLRPVYLRPSARRFRWRRGTVTLSSLLRLPRRFRNVDRMPFGAPLRVVLRTRLTLIRLTLIRNPWSCGVNVSHTHYRYLCLHLLFQTLQNASRRTFTTVWNAPLPNCNSIALGTASAACLTPAYYPRPAARLVSCYALFR